MGGHSELIDPIKWIMIAMLHKITLSPLACVAPDHLITFTTGNWDTAQTVTVTGVNDDLDDGNISVTIALAIVDDDSHDSYDNVANQTVSVVNADNDSAGFTITQSGGSTTVTEDAATDTFTLVLKHIYHFIIYL